MAMGDVPRILSAIDQGEPGAAEQLLPLVYDELHRLAAQKMARQPAGHTLQPTALVHEAFLRLVKDGERRPWDSRGHFFAAAAEAMRRILVEHARRKAAVKHGGALTRRELIEDRIAAAFEPREDLIALDKALDQLARKDPVKARLVNLRYFAGLTVDEAARRSGSRPQRPNATGLTPGHGCTVRSAAVPPRTGQTSRRKKSAKNREGVCPPISD